MASEILNNLATTGFAALESTTLPGVDYSGLMSILLGIIVVAIIFAVISYIYSAITLMKIAKRLGTEPAWLAWVPIGNLYLTSKMAGMHWWPILMIIPYVLFLILGSVFSVFLNLPAITILLNLLANGVQLVLGIFVMIWYWKICEARNRPGWWVLLGLIPLFGWIWLFILLGILAWGKD